VRILLVIAILLVSGLIAPASARSIEVRDDGEFTLQVATFSSPDRAEALKHSIPDAWIQEVTKEGRLVYRVNYKRFTKRSQALRAQWALEDLGHESFIQRLFS
jgi:septal ring-binding cell division protein DamX